MPMLPASRFWIYYEPLLSRLGHEYLLGWMALIASPTGICKPLQRTPSTSSHDERDIFP